MLTINDLHVSYGNIEILKGVSLAVNQGEIVTLIGANGAGKTTLLKTISGLLHPTQGTIVYKGINIENFTAEQIVPLGISHAPEGRRVFARSTVMENFMIGAFIRKDRKNIKADVEKLMKRFPILYERRNQLAGTLSGGEQQMLATSRALMSNPQLVLLDEPSMGLAPVLVREIFNIILELKNEGVTVLLVEQNALMALKIADRAYVLETGQISTQGMASELINDAQIRKSYLGEA